MARPRKEGMEYFPHDTDARNDLKIRKLRAVFGNDGYATYFILLENIYRNKHYFIEVSDAETMLILAEECKISEEKLIQIIQKCLDLDLFSKQYYEEQKILSSESIKKRTEPIENKRKKNSEHYNSIKSEVSDAETNNETDVSDAEIPAESTQSKGKKSIEKHNINIPYQEIYELYLKQGIINHKSLTEPMKKAIKKAVDKHSIDEVKLAIQRYGRIYNDKQNEYATKYGKYQWTLQELMAREKGIDEFLDEGGKWIRYNEGQTKVIELKKPVESRPNAGAYKEYTGGLL